MADAEEDYKFDPFDDGSSKMVGEKLVANMESFVQDFASQLRVIEETLDESLSDVWDSTVDPIGLNFEPYEQTKIVELTKSDNKLFNKILLVFASLSSEMKRLTDEANTRFAPPFMAFGEDGDLGEGEAQTQVGRMLNPFLMDFSTFVNRVYLVVQNVVRQLASLYHPAQKLYITSFKAIHLQTVYQQLGELLVALISLDTIITSNESFKQAWAMYKRMTKSMRAAPSRFNTDEEQLVQFEKLLLSLEGQLFDGLIFQGCIEQEFDFPGLVEVRNNRVFKTEFLLNLQTIHASLASRLANPMTGDELGMKYAGACALVALYYLVYRDVAATKDVFKKIWELQKRLQVVHLAANASWQAPEFFIKHAAPLVKTLGKIAISKQRAEHLALLDKSLPIEIQQMYLKVSVWMVRMESNLANRAELRDILNTRMALLAQGPALAERLVGIFRETVHFHVALGAPIKRSQVRALFQAVELVKAIEATFHRRSGMIGQSLPLMARVVCHRLQSALMPIKARLEAAHKYSDAKLDVLAAATLSLNILQGAPTYNRLLLLRLCLHVLFQPDFVKEQEMEELKAGVKKLELLSGLGERIRDSTKCEFLFWSKNMLPPHLDDIYANPETAHKLHYLCAALQDVVPLLRAAVHKPGEDMLTAFKNHIDEIIKSHLLDRLCRDIETDLRLHIHSHLAVSERDPWKNGLQDLASLVRLRPLRVFDKVVDVAGYVGHYLDTTFYNLTTVALYDWQTYGEMRNLAAEKYGLHLTEVHLPGQTLDQGLDVLEIMRNIHIFVSKYNYNLNNQIFVEAGGPNKTINTINIAHIANSIRTHGTGIMNTTVNFTYQFLRQKFVIFSQFLYDEHIKARLFKDIRFFKESKTDKSKDPRYPYARAEAFNKEIRKLGITEQGLSYLDQFRILITEIGNAMGYIRMIRSGGLYHTSNAIKFVPDLASIPSFGTLATSDQLPEHTVDAAKNLDATINYLARNFAEGTEYFKMLVNVFAPEFRDARNVHLKNFHIIIPPLTLNFVQHILKTKDKLTKKGALDPAFSDDGFAIGLVYILKLLGQHDAFDSLHWWEAVEERHRDEEAKLQALAKAKVKDKEEQQTLNLTLRKLISYRNELQLLRFSFDSSRIFFKD